MPTFKVLQNRKLSDNTFVLRTERPKLEIIAGQCFSIGTTDLGINREYSMYSAASDDFVDFLIRRVEGGSVSSRLYGMKPGDLVEIGGPYGQFCLDKNRVTENKFLFIASGTGIAPFHSFIASYPEIDYEIIHGVRYESEKYDHDHYSSDRYKSAISRPFDARSPERVTDLLKKRIFNSDEIVYLCGNRSMIIDCVQILRERGIHGDSIFMETFF